MRKNQVLKHLHLIPPLFPGSTFLHFFFLPLPNSSTGALKMEVVVSSKLICTSPSTYLFPSSSVVSFPWDTVLYELFQHGILTTGCSSSPSAQCESLMICHPSRPGYSSMGSCRVNSCAPYLLPPGLLSMGSLLFLTIYLIWCGILDGL